MTPVYLAEHPYQIRHPNETVPFRQPDQPKAQDMFSVVHIADKCEGRTPKRCGQKVCA